MIDRIKIFPAIAVLCFLFVFYSASSAADPEHWAFVRPKAPRFPRSRIDHGQAIRSMGLFLPSWKLKGCGPRRQPTERRCCGG